MSTCRGGVLADFSAAFSRSAAARSKAPKPYVLSPEASKAIIQLEAQRKAMNDEIDKSENFVFLGAQVPPDSRQCGWDASGIVTCSKAEVKAASPEKK